MTVGAIQNTDSTSHSSRCKLSSIVSDAVNVFTKDDDHFIPLGRWNDHRFGLHPVRNVEQAYGDLRLFLYPSWKKNNLEVCEVAFGVRGRTYSQLWCSPPETGLPQSGYDRCFAKGLLGSSTSPYSLRQPEPDFQQLPRHRVQPVEGLTALLSTSTLPRHEIQLVDGPVAPLPPALSALAAALQPTMLFSRLVESTWKQPLTTIRGRSGRGGLRHLTLSLPTLPINQSGCSIKLGIKMRGSWNRALLTLHSIVNLQTKSPSMDDSGPNTSPTGHARKVMMDVDGRWLSYHLWRTCALHRSVCKGSDGLINSSAMLICGYVVFCAPM